MRASAPGAPAEIRSSRAAWRRSGPMSPASLAWLPFAEGLKMPSTGAHKRRYNAHGAP
jgi:hypothetical protein